MKRHHVVFADAEPVPATLTRVLEQECHITVSVVTRGDQLVRVLKRHHVDLLVLDTRLRNMPGLAAAGVARALESGLRIIMTTNRHSAPMERRCRRLGLVYYAVKPIEPETLLETIRAALSPPRCVAAGHPVQTAGRRPATARD